MKKIFRVFVSSTYIDLIEPRDIVIRTLLLKGCFPVSMELFSSSNKTQWDVIKKKIDSCDYFVLLIGGKYGCLAENGLSFTHNEYNYALKKRIPIISFLIKDPMNLPLEKSETSSKSIKKLTSFRSLVQQKLCNYWENANDLSGTVSISLEELIKDSPRLGWISAANLPKEDEVAKLKRENEELRKENLALRNIAANRNVDISSDEESFIEIHRKIEILLIKRDRLL